MDAEDITVLRQYLFKEVDLIQNIISRLARNSFLMKGWTITLVVATLLLKATTCKAWIAYGSLLIFWFLDAWFLRKERMYKALYKWVIQNRLRTDEYLLDMNTERFADEVGDIHRIMFSFTLGWFYVPIGVLITLYTFVFC